MNTLRLSVSAAALCIVLCGPHATADDPVIPLPQAHAHNDYLHERPLLDALDNGFCSVEADIFLVDGKLLVAHSRSELSSERTLEDLYLRPLQERIRDNDGQVYKDGPTFHLLVDIKNTGAETWLELNSILSGYSEILSRVEGGTFHQKAVNVAVSGDRAWDVIEATSPRYAGVDGRLSDIGSDRPVHLMPLISDNWSNHFRWRGDGDIPVAERNKLRQLVGQTRAENRRIRFWATPDTPAAWRVLEEAGADLINSDDLPGLSTFLRSKTHEAGVTK